MKKFAGSIISAFLFLLVFSPSPARAFRFVAWADTKNGTNILQQASVQAAALNPNFTVYPGDICETGPDATCFPIWRNALNGGSTPGNGMFDKTFTTRGNHDTGDTNYFISVYDVAGTAARIGATNLTQLNTDLTYSFDYGNSHFAGVDLTGGSVYTMSTAQMNWLDQDLTAAENRGLTHAFLFWHGPLYTMASHCCTPNPTLNLILDKHPIVSATFHGHEHIVTYVHMDSTRYPEITHPYEQFISGDVGAYGTTSDTVISGRYDYWMTNAAGFVAVDVNNNTFTVNFYKLNVATPVNTMTFTKGSNNQPTPTPVVSSRPTPSPTSTPRPSPTASTTPRPTPTASPGLLSDANGDGRVTVADFLIWVNNYAKLLTGKTNGDFYTDGKINGLDFGVFAYELHAPTPTPGSSPVASPTVSPLPSGSTACQKLSIPAYFYPGALWTQMNTAGGSKIYHAIMNLGNGPGTSQNSTYVSAVNAARAAGIRVMGYTYTQYGARSAAIIKADIDSYKNWYGVTDIFFDEASNASGQIPYYQDLANYTHANGGQVMLNPGTIPDQGYAAFSDILLVFENSYANYVGATFPSWINSYPASKFAHYVYGTSSTDVSQALSLSKQRHAGLVYITDDVLTNPWDTLPSYWSTELAGLCP